MKKILFVLGILHAGVTTMDFDEIVLPIVKAALNSDEIQKALSVFPMTKNQMENTFMYTMPALVARTSSNAPMSNLNIITTTDFNSHLDKMQGAFSPEYFGVNELEDIFINATKFDATKYQVADYCGYVTGATTIAPKLAKNHNYPSPYSAQIKYSVNSKANFAGATPTFPTDFTYDKLGYTLNLDSDTDTKYVKFISNNFYGSHYHLPFFKTENIEIRRLPRFTNSLYSGGTTNPFVGYPSIISLQFHRNPGNLLSDLVFTFVYDQDLNNYICFTNLDAQIIWNIAYNSSPTDINSDGQVESQDGYSQKHVTNLTTNPFYSYYPNFTSISTPVKSQILQKLSGQIPNIFNGGLVNIQKNTLYTSTNAASAAVGNRLPATAFMNYLNIQENYFGLYSSQFATTTSSTTPPATFLLPILLNGVLKNSTGGNLSYVTRT